MTIGRHIERCRLAMAAGGWWTLSDLATVIGCSEAAASARVRDLRKARYGGHRILRRHTGPGGLHRYRLVPEKKVMAHAAE